MPEQVQLYYTMRNVSITRIAPGAPVYLLLVTKGPERYGGGGLIGQWTDISRACVANIACTDRYEGFIPPHLVDRYMLVPLP